MKKRSLITAIGLTLFAGMVAAKQAQAVSIAILDTGLNVTYAGVEGRVDEGIDLIDGVLPAQDESSNLHGSSTSRIAAAIDGRNRIMPVRVGGGSASLITGSVLIQGINFAARSQARVMNLSLGSRDNSLDPAILNALKGAAGAGKFIALAAGNQGRPNPTFVGTASPALGGSAITVGALDPSGRLASYSNRAGYTQNTYVVAPGYTSFNSNLGTSFATPRVAGTAAAIWAQNPNLSARQVANIILTTADDLGAPGTDPVYGRGRLNTAAALAPVGDIEVPDESDDSSSSSSGAGLAVGALVVAGAVAAAILYRNKTLEQTLVLDSYDRPYQVDLGGMISVRDDSFTLDSLMLGLRQTTEAAYLPVTEDLQMTIWYDRSDSFENLLDQDINNPEYQSVDNWSLSLQKGSGQGAFYALNMNMDPRQYFGLAEDTSRITLFDRRSLTAPYAGFASTATMGLTGYRTEHGHEIRLGVVDMNEDRDYGLRSRSLLFEGSLQPNDRIRLGVQVSALAEQGSLFGGASGGVLGVDGAETVAGGLSASYKLRRNLSLQAMYSQGLTWVRDSGKSVLKNFSTLLSDSYGAGLQASGVLHDNDRVSLTVSRPLHVYSGDMTLSVPTTLDYSTRDIIRSSEQIDFADTPRQTDLELGYHRQFGKQSGMAAYMLYRHDPASISDYTTAGRYGLMFNISSRF